MSDNYLVGVRKTIIKALQEATDLDTINYWVAELRCLNDILEAEE